jgi:hypothetical protein
LKGRVEQLKELIEGVKYRHEDARFNRKIYLHVLERMKQTKIHLDVTTYHMTNSLKNKRLVQINEEKQMLKAKETKVNTKYALTNMKESMAFDSKKK